MVRVQLVPQCFSRNKKVTVPGTMSLIIKIQKTKMKVKAHLPNIYFNLRGELKGKFVEDQNIFLDLLTRVKK